MDWTMKDVPGLSLDQALAQLPEEEANDSVWPYHTHVKRTIAALIYLNILLFP